jgi:hypothetical protein
MDRWIKGKTAVLALIATLAVAGGIAVLGVAFAQQLPGQIKLQSFANPFGIGTQGPGPTSSFLLVSGGTVTCSGGATVSVANANIDAGSAIILTLQTVGGTVAAPFVSTITVGGGFTVKCGASDTSVYNYVVIG